MRPARDMGAPASGAPKVIVPDDPAMALEPAETIAKAMQLKNAIAMILAVSGIAIAPALNDAIDNFLQAAIGLGFLLWTAYSTWKQGKDTRAAVYAPDTVAKIVDSAYDPLKPETWPSTPAGASEYGVRKDVA